MGRQTVMKHGEAARRSRRAAIASILALSLSLHPLLVAVATAQITSTGDVIVGSDLTVGNVANGTRTVEGVVDGPFGTITLANAAAVIADYIIANGGTASSVGRTTIGRFGSGALSVSGGGVFTTTGFAGGDLVVGDQPGAEGFLHVTGAGSYVGVMRNLFVGFAGSTGTVTIEGGAQLATPRIIQGPAQLVSGVGQAATGNVHVKDPGSVLTITGQSSVPFFNPVTGATVILNQLSVGSGGPGRLDITGGGRVDMAPNFPDHQAVINVGTFQNGRGGDGIVVVDGAGSELRLRGTAGLNPSFNIGQGDPASVLLTPGLVTVSGGGALVMEPANAAGGAMRIGRMTGGTGTLVVTGTGSLVSAPGTVEFGRKAPSDPATAGDGHGVLTVTAGGSFVTNLVRMDNGTLTVSAGGQFGSRAVLVGDAGVGSAVVEGANSLLHLSGLDAAGNPPGINVGLNGGAGAFTLRDSASIVIDGASVTSAIGPGITIGREGGSGAMLVESGAALTLLANNAGGGFTIGRTPGVTGTLDVLSGGSITIISNLSGGGFTVGDAGTGTLTVSGAGSFVLQDGQAPTATPGITLGNVAGGSGTLAIADGAVWTINRSAAGCCMTIGRLGHGALHITGGGQMVFNDSSTGGLGGFSAGGNAGVATGGTFDILVSGSGSTLSLLGTDAVFTLGRASGASGSMTVDQGASLNADIFVVGRTVGTNASMTVSGSGTTVNLVGDAGGITGAGFSVGAAGTGIMDVSAGAVVTIDGTATSLASGFFVGGSRLSGSGGTGTFNVDGVGTLIRVLGGDKGFNVGFDSTCLNNGPCNQPSSGTMTVSGGARVLTDADNRSSIGSHPGSVGTVTVTDTGSLIDAGAFLGIGRDRDGNAGGTGALTVTMGGTVKATTINCGAGGTIGGDGGTLIGEVIADPACVIAPGFSPGTLNIVGNFSNLGARIVLEVDAFGNHDVLAVEGTATFDPATQIEVRIHPLFQPAGGVTLPLVQVQPTAQTAPQPLLTLAVSESGGGTLQTDGDLSNLSTPIAVTPDDSIQPTVRAVTIDVKPGSSPNVVNLGSAGTIPVAILSTPAFDALTVDPATILLSGASVKLVGKTQRPLCSSQDVNADGRGDLVCHVQTSELLVAGDGPVILDAMTFRGTSGHGIPVRGNDFITVVP